MNGLATLACLRNSQSPHKPAVQRLLHNILLEPKIMDLMTPFCFRKTDRTWSGLCSAFLSAIPGQALPPGIVPHFQNMVCIISHHLPSCPLIVLQQDLGLLKVHNVVAAVFREGLLPIQELVFMLDVHMVEAWSEVVESGGIIEGCYWMHGHTGAASI